MTDLPNPDFAEPIEKIRAALEATPKKSRRILLKTLLKEFGFKVRSPERLGRITAGLTAVGVHISPDLETCDREGWVTLALLDPPLPDQVEKIGGAPDIRADIWFEDVCHKVFASEKEVEIRFIVPLLERLGYREEDRADGFPVDIVVGVRKTRAEADFVLFDGSRRDANGTLLVVEAKKAGKILSGYVAQARSYAMFLNSPYYMITNGDDIRVFMYRNPIEADVEVYTGKRQELRATFSELYALISRDAVVGYRRTWTETQSRR